MAPSPKRMKIGPKTIGCVFIGYAQHSNAYRFIVYESKNPDIHKNTIIESKNASFFEHVFPYKETRSSSPYEIGEDTTEMYHQQEEVSEEDTNVEEPRRSKRARVENSYGPDFLTFMVEAGPRTYDEATSSIDGPIWKEAIKSELDSILQNYTWELVNLPQGCKPLDSKWIFTKKVKVDGTVEKYKARLVIKGYRQKEGLDYFDTFSPVTRITSIRKIIAIAALQNLEIHQMNAPKQWHEKFDKVILSNGFKINECDKCVYSKNTEHGYVILCLYADDILIVGNNEELVKSTKTMLNSRFDMKDLGLANVILGIKITRMADGFVLSQAHYADKILDKFAKDIVGVYKTPIDMNHHLSKNKDESIAQVEHSRVIGSVMYLMNCTRPDIAYSVSRLARYTSNPGSKHWKAIVRVLKYLRFTHSYGLHYIRYPEIIEGYTDASWISDIQDSKATSGYVFTLGGAAVSWKSSKQTLITRSTMEVEFVALDKCGK
ncbi:unnamed protein product [Rhodiola kirilowii]